MLVVLDFICMVCTKFSPSHLYRWTKGGVTPSFLESSILRSLHSFNFVLFLCWVNQIDSFPKKQKLDLWGKLINMKQSTYYPHKCKMIESVRTKITHLSCLQPHIITQRGGTSVNAFSPSSINSGAQGLRRKALIAVLPLNLRWIIIRTAHMDSNECYYHLTTELWETSRASNCSCGGPPNYSMMFSAEVFTNLEATFSGALKAIAHRFVVCM